MTVQLKRVMVELLLDQDQINKLVEMTENNSNAPELVTETNSIRDEIQFHLYDEGGFDGHFNINSIEEYNGTFEDWMKEKGWG